MASHFQRSMETSLIMNHNERVRQLETEYANRICELLKQKSMIMNSLQQQFLEQRSRIHQTFSSPQNTIIHEKNHNYHNTNDPTQTSEFFSKIKQEINRMNASNPSTSIVNTVIATPPSIPNVYSSISVKREPVSADITLPHIDPPQALGQAMNYKVKNGDCVWAKYQNYPWWPGQIELISQVQNAQNSKVSVKWFGDFSEKSNECDLKNIIPWDPKKKDGILLTVKSEDMASFNSAFNDCCKMHLQRCKAQGLIFSKKVGMSKKKMMKVCTKMKVKKYKRNKVYKCPHCDYSTNVTTNLRNHIRTHTGEKPYVCTFEGCGKRFAAKGNLTDHVKRHYGDKQFKCPLCDKAFVNKYELKTHIRKKPDCKLNQDAMDILSKSD